MTLFDAKAFCRNLESKPGVYLMLSASKDIIYIGKSKNLKSRVASYFSNSPKTRKISKLVSQISGIDIMRTNTELEALILEHNLIKQHRPKYNVIFKDDKSFPYIAITTKDPFPGIYFHRGSKNDKNQYFGPFPNPYAARNSLSIIQKTFRIRNCDQSTFNNRTRPCMQYQIDRCSAPCVGKVSTSEYEEDIQKGIKFLQGKASEVIHEISEKMNDASRQQNYERAAILRDQVLDLNEILKRQIVSVQRGDFDVVGIAESEISICLSVMYFRNGRLLGSKQVTLESQAGLPRSDIIEAYIMKHYFELNLGKVSNIYVSESIASKNQMEELINAKTNSKIKIIRPLRGEPKKWVQLACDNAKQTLLLKNQKSKELEKQFKALRKMLDIKGDINRIECFDISHLSGSDAVASCVVFDEGGANKKEYRKFNIANIKPSDDYDALRQAFSRRYVRLLNENKRLPDLVVIDGGKGQLNAIIDITKQLALPFKIISISKGRQRKLGQEQVHSGGKVISIDFVPEAGRLLQQIRDEAHRFAITAQRKKRSSNSIKTILDDIPGIGPKRRKNLIQHFGNINALTDASVEEIEKVKEISKGLAKEIYQYLH
ncbi:MAG: excinuclease ABC subunit UvrC [Proteobacteria bacterium]|nr:excinuclease ABC subunit UvrC [Pseudomonadota bacterium]